MTNLSNLQHRERLLIGGFAGVIGAFVIVPWLWSWFTGPIDNAQAALDLASGKLTKAQDDLIGTRKKQASLKTWKSRSLSPQIQEAGRQYQQWITDLAEESAQFSQLQVTAEPSPSGKKSVFNSVKLRVKAEATLAQVRLFLFRFSQADLMHAVTSLSLESPATSGNPLLSVNMQIEALSFPDAAPRGPTVFTRTKVAEKKWKSGAEQLPLQVQSNEKFPAKTPFIVRIGKHYFDVVDRDGLKWAIKPEANFAATSPSPIELVEDQTVELVQIHPDFANRTLADFDPILKQNLFLKPVPYAPKLDFSGPTSVSLGGSLNLTCQASGFDLSIGAPSFSLFGEQPKGMSFDAGTGKLTWKPDNEQPLGDINLKVTANAPGLKEPLTKPLTLSLKQTNKSPTIERIGDRHAVLGKEFKLTIKATDEDSDLKSLKFSLGGSAPAGAKIDATSGELTWTPADATIPGPVKVTVQVADNGNPPATASQEFTINVGDDLAQFTELTSIIEVDGRREFWLSDKSTNKLLKLHEGETLKYADIEAKVARIDRRFVLLEKEDAQWRLNLGENLKSLKKLE